MQKTFPLLQRIKKSEKNFFFLILAVGMKLSNSSPVYTIHQIQYIEERVESITYYNAEAMLRKLLSQFIFYTAKMKTFLKYKNLFD